MMGRTQPRGKVAGPRDEVRHATRRSRGRSSDTVRTMVKITIAALITLASSLHGQTTHLVGFGPGAFAEIRDALAAAAPGDIVRVAPGSYAHFDVTFPVAISAAVPGTVLVSFDPTYVPPGCNNIFCLMGVGPTRVTLAPTDTVEFHGLQFDGNQHQVSGLLLKHRLVVAGGTLILDRCRVTANDHVALTATDSTLHLQESEVLSTSILLYVGDAMQATRCQITAVDSTFTSNCIAGLGGAGIALASSTLHGSRLVLQGSTNNAALECPPNSRVWLADSTLAAGVQNSCALYPPGGNVHLARCVLVPGGPNCAPAPVTMPGVHRRLPPTLGGQFAVDITSTPNALMFLVGSYELRAFAVAEIAAPWFAHPGSAVPLGALVTDPAGYASVSWNLPATLPVADLSLWLHVIEGLTLPLPSAPPVGGRIR